MAIRVIRPLKDFIRTDSGAGTLLILVAAVAFGWANIPELAGYYEWMRTIELPTLEVGGFAILSHNGHALNLTYFVNDFLMAIFFLYVGLEIKRELVNGELSRPRDAALPAVAALGGMVVPALIYVFFTYEHGAEIQGWGIPMATDIAFVIGLLALLGKRVPVTVKIFLTALAIVDDLGAVAVIAIFYSANISAAFLGFAAITLVIRFVYNIAGGQRLLIYLFIGLFTWVFILHSGVHATIAGILIAISIPMRGPKTDKEVTDPKEGETYVEDHDTHKLHVSSPLHRLEHMLSPWVAYLIMPVFALFNAGIQITSDVTPDHPVSLGVFFGLLVGKPLGVFCFSLVAILFGWASMPRGARYLHILGAGILAGIGFTMSLFITNLAFKNVTPESIQHAGAWMAAAADHGSSGMSAAALALQQLLVKQASLAIFVASICAAVAGMIVMIMAGGSRKEEKPSSGDGDSSGDGGSPDADTKADMPAVTG